ncbi:MAG: hypothetical protein FH761_11230 [Firmicutes bacterium]|nr:hypothetical protein [Bacillota bacterium]
MKYIKGFFLTFVIFSFILVLILSQLLFAFNSTFLSSKYFNNSFEKNNISTSIKDIFINRLEANRINANELASPPLNKFEENNLASVDLGRIILEHLDQNWVEEQISLLIKESFAFVFDDSNALPIIDIKITKDNFFKGLITEAMKQASTNKDIETIGEVIKLLDNKYMALLIDNDTTDEIVNQILNLEIVKASNLDRDMILTIIKVYRENRSDNIDEISHSLVSEMFNSKIDINNYKDYFDLNLFLEKSFDEVENPFYSLKILISSIRSITLRTILLLLLVLIIIVIIANFSIKGTIKWLSNGLIIAGLSSILIGLLKFFPFISKILYYNTFYKIQSAQSTESIHNFQYWIQSFVDKFFTMLIIQGIILTALAILALVAIRFTTYNYTSNYDDSDDLVISDGTAVKTPVKSFGISSPILLTAIRVIITSILIILIPVISLWGTRGLKYNFHNYKASTALSLEHFNNKNMLEIMKNVLEKK